MGFYNQAILILRALRFEIFISALITSIICRIVYILGLQPGLHSLLLFCVIFFLVGSYCPIILPSILDRIVFQRFIFYTFYMENLIKANPNLFTFLVYFLPAAVFSHFCVTSGFYDFGLLFINFSIYIFLLKSYARLKELFFNPDFNTSFEGFNDIGDLYWSNLFDTMSSLSAQRFGRPLTNRLPNSVWDQKFPNIVSSYMISKKNLSFWTRIASREEQMAVKKFASIGIGSAVVASISAEIEERRFQAQVAASYWQAMGQAASGPHPKEAIEAFVNQAPKNRYINGTTNSSWWQPSFWGWSSSTPPKGGSGGMVSRPLEEKSSLLSGFSNLLSYIF